jgi:integrase
MAYEQDIVGHYQRGLLSGACAANKKALSVATVNAYVDEAVLFLKWAAERGHRGPFKVPRRRVRVPVSNGAHSYSYMGPVVTQRHGKLQVTSDPLPTLASAKDVARWMKTIQLRAPVKALIFEFMFRTGARLSEANQLRTTCFPDKSFGGNEVWPPRWALQGWVPVTLRYGVKGGKVEPASAFSTRSRVVEVPIDLADRIWHYKQLIRPTLLRRFTRGDKSKDKSNGRLWLGEKKAQPVSNTMLYRAWVAAPLCPLDWHPQSGRHFFAVERICEATRLQLRLRPETRLQDVSIGWLHGLMAGQVRLILSPLMGHVNEDTTMRYLRCALQRLIESASHPAFAWNQLIDADLDDA